MVHQAEALRQNGAREVAAQHCAPASQLGVVFPDIHEFRLHCADEEDAQHLHLDSAASTEPPKPRNPATSSPNSTPAERDTLVRAALRYEALRARRPNVWLPRDDLGVYDEEVRKLEGLGRGNIWVTKHGTASDRRERMVYGRNPPDFSEVDLIVL